MITELSPETAKQLLQQERLGRLGCCFDNEPYVIPVNYLFDGECLYIHSLPGRKIEMLRANPRACLQVDHIVDDYNWQSAIAYGNYEEIADDQEREHLLAMLYRHLPHLSPVESRMKTGRERALLFRIRVDRISGVSERW